MPRNLLSNLAGNMTLAVLAIASGKAISSWYGPSGRGILGASQVAIALAATLGGLGLGDAILYNRATNLVSGDSNGQRDIFVRDRGAFGARTRANSRSAKSCRPRRMYI